MGRTHCVLALLCIVMFLPGVATSMDVYWEKTFDSRGFDEGRSIAATDDTVVVGGFSRDFDDEYHLLIYNSTGNLVWRRDIDGFLWDKNLRNVALAIYNDTIILSCTDRTFLTMAYAFNGTRLWEHTWGSEYSVTDLTVDDTGTTYVLGCTAGTPAVSSAVLKYTPNGILVWNVSLASCGYGITLKDDILYIVGQQGSHAMLYALNTSGTAQWNQSYGKGVLHDVAVHDSLYLLQAHTGQASLIKCHPNGTIQWTQNLSGEREVHGLAVDEQGMVFIAGSMYNKTSNDDDFWVGGFLANGSKIQQFHYNGLGSQQDSAWAICADPLLVATGYIVDKETFPGPPPYVQFNRNIYTLRLELQNLPPDVNFSWSPIQAETGEKITFTDHSLDPDGTIAAWRWDFGDGKLAVLETPTHSYEDSGTYAVTLTVTDDDGEERSLIKNIEVVSAGNGGIPGFELALMLMAAALILLKRR